MKYLSILVLITISTSTFGQIPSTEIQIKMAVQAAPADQREGATVLGYNQEGKLVELRSGDNQTVCLGDDPNQKGISVSCYHESLEPFMQRGRALRAEGKGRMEIFNIREDEVKNGSLKMPDKVTLHILSGAEAYYDEETETIKDANLRWVIYIPYATTENTGLPLAPPFPGAPWLMDPGTHRAHIMVTPPRDN